MFDILIKHDTPLSGDVVFYIFTNIKFIDLILSNDVFLNLFIDQTTRALFT